MHTSATFFFFFLHSLNSTFQWPEAQNPSNWQRISTRRARYFRSCKGIRPIPVVRSHDFFFARWLRNPARRMEKGRVQFVQPIHAMYAFEAKQARTWLSRTHPNMSFSHGRNRFDLFSQLWAKKS